MGASDPIELAAEIVAAFVSNNPLPKSDLPALIHAMHAAVASLSTEAKSPPPPDDAERDGRYPCHPQAQTQSGSTALSSLVDTATQPQHSQDLTAANSHA